MRPYEAQVRALKTSLVEAEDIEEPSSLYHEMIADLDFAQTGTRKKSQFLETMIAKAGHAYFGQRVPVVMNRIRFIAHFRLYHGVCIVNNFVCTLFYFTDVQKGLLTLHHATGTEIFRMTAQIFFPKGPSFLANPSEPATD